MGQHKACKLEWTCAACRNISGSLEPTYPRELWIPEGGVASCGGDSTSDVAAATTASAPPDCATRARACQGLQIIGRTLHHLALPCNATIRNFGRKLRARCGGDLDEAQLELTDLILGRLVVEVLGPHTELGPSII